MDMEGRTIDRLDVLIVHSFGLMFKKIIVLLNKIFQIFKYYPQQVVRIFTQKKLYDATLIFKG